MTTALSYNGSVPGTISYIDQIATMAVVEPNDPNFLKILPAMIVYAENRMFRDLDFLFTSTNVTGYSLSAGLRTLTIPEGTLVVSEQINILTPVGQTNPNDGSVTRNPCLPTTKEFLDAVYGSNTSVNRAMPRYFAPFNDNVFLFGPVPDAAYGVEIVGTYRPASLSVSTTETFISKYLPDLLIMASMIYISAFQRNFGRANDDPQMAVTYESQYNSLLKGASVEEARKKFEASGWSSQAPAPVATPSRG
jgi:hypothetical protein